MRNYAENITFVVIILITFPVAILLGLFTSHFIFDSLGVSKGYVFPSGSLLLAILFFIAMWFIGLVMLFAKLLKKL